MEIRFDLRNPETLAFIRSYSFPLVRAISADAIEPVRRILERNYEKGALVRTIRKELERSLGWSRELAEVVASTETMRAANAGAAKTYVAGGHRMQWLATEDDRVCAHCLALGGRIVRPGENFLEMNALSSPRNADFPLLILHEPVAHPPLHLGCRCALVPVVG